MTARPPVFVVLGLGFGDEGKGSVVDWLVRRHGAAGVVRYNGGPQAAHHVVTADGRVHCAAQLGAGALAGIRTHLARTVLVDPLALHAEAEALVRLGAPGVASPADALARLTIDPRSIVVTPLHAAANRILELARGANRHGSCGRGVGQAQLDAERGAVPSLSMAELAHKDALAQKLAAIARAKIDLAEQHVEAEPAAERSAEDEDALRTELARLKDRAFLEAVVTAFDEVRRGAGAAVRLDEAPRFDGPVVLEGAQGLLLDRDHGFFPYVTPSRTTFASADACIAALFPEEPGCPRRPVVRVGVLRAYATRHGAGPFVTEDGELGRVLPEPHNGTHPWQGRFRVGPFDAPAARYALRVAGGVDALVLTCVDRLVDASRRRGAPPPRAAIAYDRDGAIVRDLPTVFPHDAPRDARTAWWAACTPRFVDLPRDPERLVAWFESPEALGIPVRCVSTGPTAAAKHLRSTRDPRATLL
jgi:adenylosuccinate synthase